MAEYVNTFFEERLEKLFSLAGLVQEPALGAGATESPSHPVCAAATKRNRRNAAKLIIALQNDAGTVAAWKGAAAC